MKSAIIAATVCTLALGTIGGLLVSLPAIILLLPLFSGTSAIIRRRS